MRAMWIGWMLLATGCGSAMEVLNAAGEYKAADDEYNAYQNQKAQEAEAGYTAGNELHAKYMGAKLPDLKPSRLAVEEWGKQSQRVIEALNKSYTPVMYSHKNDRVFFAHLRLAEASEKRTKELLPLWEPLTGDDRMMSKSHVMQALMDTASYYKFAAEDAETHEEVGKRYAEQAALARQKAAEYKAKYEAVRDAD